MLRYQCPLSRAVTRTIGKCGAAASHIRHTSSGVTTTSGHVGVGMDKECRDMERSCCNAGCFDITGFGSHKRTRRSSPDRHTTIVPLNFVA